MSRVALFGEAAKPKRPRWTGSTALMLLDQLCCPRCRERLEVVYSDQLPLFRHGGYGEVTREIHHNCMTCLTSRKVLVLAINPRSVA
jgi:uncharacterized protein YbaR (Trm112 family)